MIDRAVFPLARNQQSRITEPKEKALKGMPFLFLFSKVFGIALYLYMVELVKKIISSCMKIRIVG
jgi:hypothetical protein